MTKETVFQLFLCNYHNGRCGDFYRGVKENYLVEKEKWTFYLTSLCSAGMITKRQAHTWSFPGNKKYAPSENPAATTVAAATAKAAIAAVA